MITPRQARHIRHLVNRIVEEAENPSVQAVHQEVYREYVMIESGYYTPGTETEPDEADEPGYKECKTLLEYGKDCALNVHHMSLEDAYELFDPASVLSEEFRPRSMPVERCKAWVSEEGVTGHTCMQPLPCPIHSK